MAFSLQSCTLIGLESKLVTCEADLACQIPSFSLVGLPSSITQESKERVRAAYQNSGFEWPARKITINLLPAHLPKWGSHFELPMALSIFGATSLSTGHSPVELRNVFAVGELSLSGNVNPCKWISHAASGLELWASRFSHEKRRPTLFCHPSDATSLTKSNPKFKENWEIITVKKLSEGFKKLEEKLKNPTWREIQTEAEKIIGKKTVGADFKTLSQVEGEPRSLMAAIVAIAGGHHVLFAGPQGSGKSMLIQGICEGSFPLKENQAIERQSLLESLSSLRSENFKYPRPVAALQTSITRPALEGSLLKSGQIQVGELTNAHLGVLVADELLELRRDVIEALRQPLEEKIVRLQRAELRTELPADFQFLASTNLCPCGFLGKYRRDCRCRKAVTQRYLQKLSGPLVDRFDLVCLVGVKDDAIDDRYVDIPLDLRPVVQVFNDPKNWPQMFERCEKNLAADVPVDVDASIPVSPLFNPASQHISRRGLRKIESVARTIARLLGEPLSERHLRLSLELRQDLEDFVRKRGAI